MNKYCSQCGEMLTLSNTCARCGHIMPTTNINDGQCEFMHGAKRCPAQGTISPSINGDGRWYCEKHYRNRHDKQVSIDILENYLIHGVPDLKDWRDILLEKHLNGDT